MAEEIDLKKLFEEYNLKEARNECERIRRLLDYKVPVLLVSAITDGILAAVLSSQGDIKIDFIILGSYLVLEASKLASLKIAENRNDKKQLAKEKEIIELNLKDINNFSSEEERKFFNDCWNDKNYLFKQYVNFLCDKEELKENLEESIRKKWRARVDCSPKAKEDYASAEIEGKCEDFEKYNPLKMMKSFLIDICDTEYTWYKIYAVELFRRTGSANFDEERQ